MSENIPQSGTIAKATKWSLFTQIISKIIPPLSSMILARIFAPEVFGIIATVTMVTSFADTFSESGFQKYIISKKYDDPEELRKDADVAYWTNLGISIILWIIISLFSTPLCKVLGNPGVELALIVACAQLPITSLSSIQVATYHRSYSFGRVFWSQLISSISNLCLTLILALVGCGFWSIIFGNITGYLVKAIMLTVKSPWHPHFYYDIRRAIGIFSFSFWIMAEGLAVWLTSWFDSFVVGNRLSAHDLGIYKNSQSVVNGVLAIPQNSITNVLLVTLSKLKDNHEKYNEAFFHSQRMLAYILLPMAAGICVFRKLAVRIAFGTGWEDAEIVVGVWALASALRVLFVSINTSVYVSKGKPKISLYCQFIDMLFLIPTCIFGINLGFEKFVILRGIMRLDIIIPNFIILSRLFDIRFRSIAKNMFKPVIATVAMTVVAVILKQMNSSMAWSFGAIGICVVFYFTLLWLIAREDVRAMLHLVKKK